VNMVSLEFISRRAERAAKIASFTPASVQLRTSEEIRHETLPEAAMEAESGDA